MTNTFGTLGLLDIFPIFWCQIFVTSASPSTLPGELAKVTVDIIFTTNA
ncbi:hypothetical protein [Synechocystis sp. PCC 7509]|nr:hypothetical protein [Synechocystis sp. PCC 7509]